MAETIPGPGEENRVEQVGVLQPTNPAIEVGHKIVGSLFGAPPAGYQPPNLRGLTLDTAIPRLETPVTIAELNKLDA